MPAEQQFHHEEFKSTHVFRGSISDQTCLSPELKGQFCLRVCIVSHLTKDQNIDAVVPEVLDAG